MYLGDNRRIFMLSFKWINSESPCPEHDYILLSLQLAHTHYRYKCIQQFNEQSFRDISNNSYPRWIVSYCCWLLSVCVCWWVRLATFFIGDPFNLCISLCNWRLTFINDYRLDWPWIRIFMRSALCQVLHISVNRFCVAAEPFTVTLNKCIWIGRYGNKQNHWMPLNWIRSHFMQTKLLQNLQNVQHVKQFYLCSLTSNSFSFPVRVLHANGRSATRYFKRNWRQHINANS